MSATCHPDTIENVKHRKSKLLFDAHGPEISYPDETLCVPCGYDVGQACIITAKILGFRNFDLFGFDYNFAGDGDRHSGEHGGRVHYAFPAIVGYRTFQTSKSMFSALLTMEYLLNHNEDLSITIHGDGLLINFIEQRIKDSMKRGIRC
jgi:hypothetical protein